MSKYHVLIAHDIEPNNAFAEQQNIQLCDKQEILERSDLITLHVSGSQVNTHYIDRETIGLMKKSMLLINTSRGHVVGEAALIDALKEKRTAAVALDVFEQEPYSGPSSKYDNCILTPYIGGFANNSLNAARAAACQECIGILSGETPENQIPVPNLTA
jgi:D-3-phosphoglycerate dehydrogenase